MNISLKTKFILTIIMVGLLAIVMVFLLDLKSDSDIDTSESIGEISFKLYDESGSVVINDRLDIYESDTLYSVLKRHYSLVCANQNYKTDESCSYKFINGYIILGIEDVQSDWYNTVLTIYINEERANYGVSMIELNDNDLIEIKRTDYHE